MFYSNWEKISDQNTVLYTHQLLPKDHLFEYGEKKSIILQNYMSPKSFKLQNIKIIKNKIKLGDFSHKFY